MQSIDEKREYYKVIKGVCYATDILYLLLHVIYLIFCIISKTYILIWFNVASIIMYAFLPLLLRKGKYYIYALICGNEFLFSMSISTILTGFQTGYFLSIVGLSIVSFFTTYFSKNKKIMNSIIWSVLSLSICLGLYIYSSFNSPYYVLDKWVEVVLFSLHIFVVFAFIVSYLMIFVKYTTKLENSIINESRMDRLTGIHNRYDLYNYNDSLLDKSDYALAIFDIDDFKHVNDLYGHIVGDYILKEVARISTSILSDSFVSRYGGEEFVILTKMNNDFNSSYLKMEALRKEIEEHEFTFNDLNIHITVTIGLKAYEGSIKMEEWINLADELLYNGKNKGKNQTVIDNN